MSDPIDQFRAALVARDIVPPDDLLADGKLHRCDAVGKPGKQDAAYLLHLDGIPAGGFENHRDARGWDSWRADVGRALTPAEEAAHRERIEAARVAREADATRRRKDAREQANLTWAEAISCAGHAYLRNKGIAAHGHGARQHKNSLVLPLRDAAGVLHSLQMIGPDGQKRFLTGGRKRGCYFSIGKPAGVLCVAEGVATGASIFEATGYAVAVAFDAGNLLPVAQALREKLPDVQIVLCADDDHMTAGNPGLTNAREAAAAVGGAVAVPDFGADRPEGATDFNDLAQARGPEAVARCVSYALDVQQDTPTTPPDEAPAPTEDRLASLARLSRVEYDRTREAEARAMGIRVGTLDKEVSGRRHEQSTTAGIDFDEVPVWHAPVRAGELLDEIALTVRRFIVCKDETARAAALWVAMTWFMDVVQIAPLAVITAPEKRCGKSMMLTLLGRLVYRPLASNNISPAAVFRAIDAWEPTLLIDEADAFMKDNEDMRGLLNGGHTRDQAYVIRVVGEDFTPTRFNIWGAKAISGIGHLADTLMDRAIILELRRKMPHESVERIRYAEPGLFDTLRSKLARFAQDGRDAIRHARPELPRALNDRAQDNWEPLLAIADVAGGDWPTISRHAALVLSNAGDDSASVGNELLADIREIFETKRLAKISTADLIRELCADDEKPWSTYNRGNPIKPRQVARRLKDYGIASKTVRFGTYDTAKGFDADQFQEAFLRYLSVTPSQPNNHAGFDVSDKTSRYGYKSVSDTLKPAPALGCGGVADTRGETDEGKEGEIVEIEI
ncbi:hypothetical protein FACS1894116_13300 [Betaproteobacteria bacterium]|nr:hypothetical protein FACS1894116_13300 [Betaproteobacteria bacterium]